MIVVLNIGLSRPASSDPVALLQEAKASLGGRQTVSRTIELLRRAIELFGKRSDESLQYAEALEIFGLLEHATRTQLDPDERKAGDLALEICELHSDPESPVLALALELKAITADRKNRPFLLARAFQVRGARVAAVPSEVPLSLNLPIATDKSKGVKFPTLSKKIEPEYPDLARQLNLECSGAMLSTVIDSTGVPGQFHLLKGCGYGFDEKATEAVKQWRFNPATEKGGQPVAFTATVQVNFRLIQVDNDSATEIT